MNGKTRLPGAVRVLALAFALVLALVVSLAPGGPAGAVPPGRVSGTAASTCDFRAIAAQHPDSALRNPDDLAGRLCAPFFLPRDYDAARDVMDLNPEAYAGYFYVNARTRHIDARLALAVAEGITQVVVLGAGFDSRAYRFAPGHPALQFIEVDLPATLAAKQQAVMRLLGRLPPYVRYAPIDFDTESLERVLARAGYDSRRRTLFVLEGVTMYVGAAGNDATFGFIARHSASGSRVVFDYIWRRVVDGEFAGLYGASSGARGVANLGEPFVTGWTPQDVEAFTKGHGLTVLEHLDAAEMTRRHLTGSNGQADGRIPEWYGIVDAGVP